MLTDDILQKAELCIKTAKSRQVKIITAESCTGGLLGACLTAIPGASDVFEKGFITYSNEAKIAHLQVQPHDLVTYGAVSSEIAKAMAQGALQNLQGSLAISITGIAGPGGSTVNKPVGLVYIGTAYQGAVEVHQYNFTGDRCTIRQQTINSAFDLIYRILLIR